MSERPYAERRATRVVFPAPGAERMWGVIFALITFALTGWVGWVSSTLIEVKINGARCEGTK